MLDHFAIKTFEKAHLHAIKYIHSLLLHMKTARHIQQMWKVMFGQSDGKAG